MKISLSNVQYKNIDLQKQENQKASKFNMPKNATSSLDLVANYNKTNIHFKGEEKSFDKRKAELLQKIKENEADYGYADYVGMTKCITPDNIDIAEKLCFGTDKNGNTLFKEKDEILYLIRKINEENADLAEKICFSNDENQDDFCCNIYYLKEILDKSQDSNFKKFIEKILFEKDENGNYIFPHREFIPQIIDVTADYNVKYAQNLWLDKDVVNNPERLAEIAPIMEQANCYNINADIIYELYFLKDDNGEDVVKNKKILSHLKTVWTHLCLQDMKEELKAFFDASSDFDTHAIKWKQNDAGYEFIALKTVELNEQDSKDKKYIIKEIISNEKGELVKNTIFYEGNKQATSWIENSDKSVIIEAKSNFENLREIKSQIEIFNNDKGEPSYIIETRPSNVISGTYDVTKYNLSDYSEDMDVIQAIKDKTITGGEKLSYTIEQEDGTIIHKKTFTNNEVTTNKIYTHKKDTNGNLQNKKISYEIVDEKGRKILKSDRSLTVNPNGTTTTLVNGKEYTAKFDDTTFKIEVKTPDNETIILDLENKCPWHSKEKFFNYAKSMFADLLIPLQYCPLIFVKDNPDSYVDKDLKLYICLNDATISHEIGHVKETINYKNNQNYMHKDKDLINIYNSEFDNFRKQNPSIIIQVLDYFSQVSGGSANTGLDEIIAETLALLTSIEDNDRTIQLRKEYLLRYFPKTIAKIADIYGYNAVKN